MPKAQPAQPSIRRAKPGPAFKQVTLKKMPSDLWTEFKKHAMDTGESVPEFMLRSARETMKRDRAGVSA